MELFEKIYGCYYQVVRLILEEASEGPITNKRMESIVSRYGYQDSALTIMPKLTGGGWRFLSQLDKEVWTTLMSNPLKPPLTHLQKSWIKSLLSDKRIQLFFTRGDLEALEEDLCDIEPLFSYEDFHYYDRYRDGDPYDSPEYQENFQTVLRALGDQKPLIIAYSGKADKEAVYELAPYQLQYSSKDDKFRLCCLRYRRGEFRRHMILNLAKINACHISKEQVPHDLMNRLFHGNQISTNPVVIEISGERNSLECCMLHFASYEKHTEYDEERGVYICSIYYDMADETELLIELLSFGPVIRVLGPDAFLQQIRIRVQRQHDLLYGDN